MIRIHSQTQLTLDGFEAPFERSMDKNNRWVKLSACILRIPVKVATQST
jgi:hypothetical protein